MEIFQHDYESGDGLAAASPSITFNNRRLLCGTHGTIRGYVNFKEAAAYCGYERSSFYQLIKGYKLPQYGPKSNRYKLSDLDEFMSNSAAFTTNNERRSTGIKPVKLCL